MIPCEIHKDFRFQGLAFQSSSALIDCAASFSEDSVRFLQAWFDGQAQIEVQTSGSTGRPKKVKLSKKSMMESARATADYFGLQAGAKVLLCLSSDHIAGKMMWVRALTRGWHLEEVSPSNSPLKGLDNVYDFSAMVPFQLAHSLKELHKIKHLLVGGAPIPVKLQAQISETSARIYATYGMTETCSHVAIKPLNFIKNAPNSYFETLPGVQISTDQRGCLVVQVPWLSKQQVVTNDRVKICSKSKFKWLGRQDNVLNSGGVKLIPEQIELKLTTFYSRRFFVTGLPDATLGQKLVLVLEGTGLPVTSKDEIKRFLKGLSLSKYEIPKAIYFVPNFVETATQKIHRKKTTARLLGTL
jgi:O-succinylbenzoic acid--CoA ligase